MTKAEMAALKALVKDISFGRAFPLRKPRLSVVVVSLKSAQRMKPGDLTARWRTYIEANAGRAWLVLAYTAHDHRFGDDTRFHSTRVIPEDLLAQPRADQFVWVKMVIDRAVLHEVDETVRVQGKLKWDPHRKRDQV